MKGKRRENRFESKNSMWLELRSNETRTDSLNTETNQTSTEVWPGLQKKAHSELVRRTARIAPPKVNARQVHQGHRTIIADVYLFWDILFNIAAFDCSIAFLSLANGPIGAEPGPVASGAVSLQPDRTKADEIKSAGIIATRSHVETRKMRMPRFLLITSAQRPESDMCRRQNFSY